MKPKSSFNLLVFVLAFLPAVMLSCKKESVNVQVEAVQENSTDLKLAGYPIDRLTGVYGATGTRTGFIGTRAGGVVAFVVDVSQYAPEKAMTAIDSKTLAIDYSDLGASGWQYLITVDKQTRNIILSPNELMAASITSGSFIVFSASFSPKTKTFHFITGYTNTSGNERTVDETLELKVKVIEYPIDRLTGVYGATGTRTGFVSTRADGVVAFVADFSQNPLTKLMTAIDSTTLATNYADLAVSDWQYLISVNKQTGKILLFPNEVMAAAITPGSFIVFSASFVPKTKTFHFITGYTMTSGNEVTVDETFVKQ